MEEKCQNCTRKVILFIRLIYENYLNDRIHFRPSPKRDSKSSKSKSSGSTSFQDFQASVSDAWDLDDDDEFCIITGLESKFNGTFT